MAVLSLRNASARRILSGGIPALVIGVAITLAGVQTQLVTLMLVGPIVAGTGFGAAFSGSMRTVMPMPKRMSGRDCSRPSTSRAICPSASRPFSQAWSHRLPACRLPPTSMARW